MSETDVERAFRVLGAKYLPREGFTYNYQPARPVDTRIMRSVGL